MWEEIGSFSLSDVYWEKRADFSYLTSTSGTKTSIAAFNPSVFTTAYTFVMTTTTAF